MSHCDCNDIHVYACIYMLTFLLASFFLLSHLSLKHVHVYIQNTAMTFMCMYMYIQDAATWLSYSPVRRYLPS